MGFSVKIDSNLTNFDMKKIAVINGVNLDRLGKREPEIYGKETLQTLTSALDERAKELGVELVHFQSNHEGELVDKIAELSDAGVRFGIINPAAFTHTSVALRDCIAGNEIKFVEVHISNIYKREEFRHNSLTAPSCVGVISGLGLGGYFAALDYLAKL